MSQGGIVDSLLCFTSFNCCYLLLSKSNHITWLAVSEVIEHGLYNVIFFKFYYKINKILEIKINFGRTRTTISYLTLLFFKIIQKNNNNGAQARFEFKLL